MPDRIFEQHVTAASGRLGAAQRQMAVAQKFVGGPAVAGENRSTNADPDAVLAVAGDQRCLEARADLFGKAADVAADIGNWSGDAEFVAAQSRDRSGGRSVALQP